MSTRHTEECIYSGAGREVRRRLHAEPGEGSMTRRLRRAGARWRLLVHEWQGRAPGEREGTCGISHTVQPGPATRPDGKWNRTHVLSNTELDEVVIDSWLHVEQMNVTQWWMDVGGVHLTVTVDRDGRPTSVFSEGAIDARDGCTYNLTGDWDD